MTPAERLSRALDRLARTRIRLLGRGRPAFLVCGFTGLFSAIVVAAGLVAWRGLPLAVVGAIALVGCGTFLSLAMAMKILTGQEQLIYYHHEIAILFNTGVVVWLLGQPVLPYLDATTLGVGAFLACGRVGCLMVGCCHGRPHGWGVRYRGEHAAAGFTPHLVGVRLFPVQLVESAWVAASVMVGIGMVMAGRAPGAAFAWYVVAYDIGRFAFEFARGDERPYHRGFSQAQWLSLLLTCGIAAAELRGVLPLTAWHLAAAPALGLTMSIVALRRRRDPAGRYRLLHAQHLDELARALRSLPRGDAVGGAIAVARTSQGIQLSTGVARGVRHHTLSRPGDPLADAEARALAGVLPRLDGDDAPANLLRGEGGVYHLVASGAKESSDETMLARAASPHDAWPPQGAEPLFLRSTSLLPPRER